MSLPLRGLSPVEAIQGVLSPAAVDAFGVLTHLGSAPFALASFAAIYWFFQRREGAVGLGVVIGAFALVATLKGAFGLPRPPEPYHLIAASGFGFPSGHAVQATVTWGLLAKTVPIGRRWSRTVVAAAVILLVCVSRVALGVHYPIDVLAGATAGLVYLGVISQWGPNPTKAFGLAVLIGAVGWTVSSAPASAAILGGGLGGLVTWWSIGESPRGWAPTDRGPLGVVAILGGVVWLLLPTTIFLVGAIGAVGVGGTLGLPALLERLTSAVGSPSR